MTAKRQTHAIDQTPEMTIREELAPRLPALPSVEHIQHELASATNLNDFFGKDGIFARLFATTIEQMDSLVRAASLKRKLHSTARYRPPKPSPPPQKPRPPRSIRWRICRPMRSTGAISCAPSPAVRWSVPRHERAFA